MQGANPCRVYPKNEEGVENMLKHRITKYQDEMGSRFAVYWFQLNLFGRRYCFNQKRIAI